MPKTRGTKNVAEQKLSRKVFLEEQGHVNHP